MGKSKLVLIVSVCTKTIDRHLQLARTKETVPEIRLLMRCMLYLPGRAIRNFFVFTCFRAISFMDVVVPSFETVFRTCAKTLFNSGLFLVKDLLLTVNPVKLCCLVISAKILSIELSPLITVVNFGHVS